MTNKKVLTRIATLSLVVVMALLMVLAIFSRSYEDAGSPSFINLFEGDIDTNRDSFLDSSVVYKLPETVKDTDVISLIICVNEEPLLDAYQASDKKISFTEYAYSDDAEKIRDRIGEEKEAILSALDENGIGYQAGADYSAILSGFEITVKAGDFESICLSLGDRATAIVGEVYNAAETELVENNVDVYDTGIFDSSDFAYDGTGIVVAILDTGLDYNHSAFSVGNFTADRSKLGLTFSEVGENISSTTASRMQSGLTASDVYINEKVPYAFDYADGDSDVFPIQNDHGTHVAGIIAGKDDTITGVAPNAQLMIMKTFSDTESSARSSWILSALEDCVVLGADVINMSLGTACGFSRESDEEALSGVYDRIRETGISLVVAASNSYNSTYGSEKNGNLGLTSNPDSSTVGSPGTYKGALSVASINGAKTSYLLYNDTIIYFTESSDRVSEEKNFYEEIFPEGVDELELEYVTVPGAGRSADYTGIDVTGKIALIARGSTTFEEKANVAEEKGAAGVIIYNNVSGDIKMNVGDTKIPVCSIRQDDGELLAAAGTGKIKISKTQASGPFMSDFSSWGPTPDLEIKPEITAHGGSILSSIPGQSYDRLSGTSMACPNISGVTALLRQYVIENFPEISEDPVKVTALVNQLMMSTADIVFNTNGLPYSVRKQGAGLANINSSAATTAYIMTYDRADGSLMDKTKIELGDDPDKTGIYTLKFSVNNFGTTALSYDLSAYVMTEGVSDTKTNDGKTTVTEQGYVLDGAKVEITSISNGTKDGSTVTVEAGKTADITVTITLSDADKKYLDESFANGMYVEGFIVLDAKSGTEISLSVPYLAFYGDWTKAPIFDLDYYATNKDELDDSIDLLDKTLPDAYATRPIGGIENDYVSYLGSYYFVQDPASKKISADRKYISLSNQTGSIHSLRFVWAGLLRNAERVVITITEDSTGEVVFEKIDEDVRKSYGDGGSIYPSNVEIEFDALEQQLKNNTSYTVNLKAYLDYGDGGENTNLSNEFEFPLVTDFEAPAVTDCEFYTEYDKTLKKTRLYAKIAVYDNHYSMAMQTGYVGLETDGYVLKNFEQYLTPIYSTFNDTSYVIYELTDYVDEIRENSVNPNCFTVACYDYALNVATYEIELPDEFTDFYFEETELTLSPNELYTLTPLVYPGTEWPELLEYYSSNASVARVVNNKLVAVAPGKAQIIARDPESKKTARFSLTVLGEGDEGYVKYDKPVTENFYLTGYYVDKAYYYLSSEDRDIGLTGDEMKFASEYYALSMFPSEAVTLRYRLDAYFPDDTEVVFESSNENIVTVDKNGKITAVAEGYASVAVRVMMDDKSTYYSKSINIAVKDPYITTGPSLTHYFGNGGVVQIPETLAITEIGQYAFSNYDYIPKDEFDEISKDSPEFTKIWYIGDSSIQEVIIPEGVKTIGPFAFANLTALTRVVLPSTLEKIDVGAFYGCTSLKTVEGLGNVKFINQSAFENCALSGTISLDSAVAIADYSFAYNAKLENVILSEVTQSVGAYAFDGGKAIKTVTVNADLIKLGQNAFRGCSSLEEIALNAAVIPAGAFDGCSSLESVSIGRDVAVIGEYAFRNTKVSKITIAEGNKNLLLNASGQYITNMAGDELILVYPSVKGEFKPNDSKITKVGNGAFSGNRQITSVVLPGVKSVGNYAFADCERLGSITLGKLESIGSYAFFDTDIKQLPSLDSISAISKYAFAESSLTSVTIPDGMTVGEGAFSNCESLESVSIGNNVTLEASAFALNGFRHQTFSSYNDANDVKHYFVVYTSPLHSLTVGDNVKIGNRAFYGASELEKVSLGSGVTIGDRAFYNAYRLKDIDLSSVTSIGNAAFSGDVYYEYTDSSFATPITDRDGYYIYRYYSPVFESVDLSALTSLGDDAFAYCRQLRNVTLGGLEKISDRAFIGCVKLEYINLSSVKTVGSNAFYETSLKNIDLSSCESIGTYAFAYNEKLASAKLGAAGTRIEEGAFAYCSSLDSIASLDKAPYIGDYAFAYTALTSADLSSAEYIGEQAFLKSEVTEFAVTLGDKLTDMGDDPFAMCRLVPFATVSTESFNGNDYTTILLTYDISDSIKVIDGSLYRVVPNGLELIAYAGNGGTVSVADNTVRISAYAFAGSDVSHVVLPYTLKSIGHKAFYACDKLVTVSFTSYKAPILEEEYDEAYYMTGTNIPATGDYTFSIGTGTDTVKHPGFEIVPYFMWNAADLPSNVYYGASFVDYVGKTDSSIVMIRPVNGQNYGSFIFGQYFATIIDGAAAADDVTLAAIKAIDSIPDNLTLADKPAVVAAREAYEKISTLEQRSLVTNIDKLTQAEKRIADLEYLENSGNTDPGPDTDIPSDPNDNTPVNETLLTVLKFSALGVAAVLIALALICYAKANPAQKKAKKGKDSSEDTAPEAEPQAEKTAEAEKNETDKASDDGSLGD